MVKVKLLQNFDFGVLRLMCASCVHSLTSKLNGVLVCADMEKYLDFSQAESLEDSSYRGPDAYTAARNLLHDVGKDESLGELLLLLFMRPFVCYLSLG